MVCAVKAAHDCRRAGQVGREKASGRPCRTKTTGQGARLARRAETLGRSCPSPLRTRGPTTSSSAACSSLTVARPCAGSPKMTVTSGSPAPIVAAICSSRRRARAAPWPLPHRAVAVREARRLTRHMGEHERALERPRQRARDPRLPLPASRLHAHDGPRTTFLLGWSVGLDGRPSPGGRQWVVLCIPARDRSFIARMGSSAAPVYTPDPMAAERPRGQHRREHRSEEAEHQRARDLRGRKAGWHRSQPRGQLAGQTASGFAAQTMPA
jgi:hypothetical protein